MGGSHTRAVMPVWKEGKHGCKWVGAHSSATYEVGRRRRTRGRGTS